MFLPRKDTEQHGKWTKAKEKTTKVKGERIKAKEKR
jgi:hypothetical protein